MAKDLTTSEISRLNILNNPVALPRIREALEIKPLEFKGVLYITKQMAADFYEVDLRTIENCLSANEDELRKNGYSVWKSNQLKEFKLHFAPEIDFGSKITQLGLFDFRSFLNIGMLLTTSEKAKQVRSLMLDIVIAVINEKTGGGTKYINRRDRNYVTSAIQEENYHRKLTDAIRDYVDGHKTYKYSTIMDMIYKAVFCEKAKEYKKLLELSEKDNLRRTLYAEVLVSVSAFENHVAETIIAKAKETLGNVRGTFSGKVMIPQAELTMDYNMFITQGQKEYDKTMETLEKRLERMMPWTHLENQRKMLEQTLELQKGTPLGIFMI